MDEPVTEPIPILAPTPPKAYWSGLILYFIAAIGFCFVLGIPIGMLFGMGILTDKFLLTVLMLLSSVSAFLGATYFCGIEAGQFTLAEIGFRPATITWTWVGIAVGLAILLIPVRFVAGAAVEYLVVGNLDSLKQREGFFSSGGSQFINFLILMLLGGILVPVAEEFYFRAALYTWFRRRYSVWLSTLITSTLFGLCHYDSLSVVVASFLLGIACAIVFEISQSIWTSILLHATTNCIAFGLMFLAMWLNL